MGNHPTRQLYINKYKTAKITYSIKKTTANETKDAYQMIKASLIKDPTIN